jgi:2-polyprenyl-6-methoxyphenol hydroxylase-like FAD-dependent oxidoreductase
VRRQYLPSAEPADTGGRCIYGKTPLGPQTPLPAVLSQGFTGVVGGRIGMAIGPVRFREPPQAFGLSPAQDYLMWALAGDQRSFGVPDEQLTALDPAGLHALSAELIRTWHPDLRALHAAADVGETFAIRVRASPPVSPWPPSRVTVLGDAIHAMSPARGSGANMALKDAALLCHALTAAPADGAGLVTAIGDYEQQMREYGYAAVAASRQAEAETGARRNRLLFWLYRARRLPGEPRGSLAPNDMNPGVHVVAAVHRSRKAPILAAYERPRTGVGGGRPARSRQEHRRRYPARLARADAGPAGQGHHVRVVRGGDPGRQRPPARRARGPVV